MVYRPEPTRFNPQFTWFCHLWPDYPPLSPVLLFFTAHKRRCLHRRNIRLESRQYASDWNAFVLLPAAMKLGQGNVFTGVWFCSRGGVFLSAHPPRAGTHPPPGRYTPPQAGTPLRRYTPPWAGTPSPPPPGSRLRHTVNERPVRILLECILVTIVFNWNRTETELLICWKLFDKIKFNLG